MPSLVAASPHQVKTLTWQIQSQTGEVVWETTGSHTPNSWWPNLTPDFCQLAAGLDAWDIATVDSVQISTGQDSSPVMSRLVTDTRLPQTAIPGCSSPTARCLLAQSDFYVCPKDGRNRAVASRCGGYEEFFCKQWGCETTGAAYWKPSSSWDLITVNRGYAKSGCYFSEEGQRQVLGLSLPLNISFTPQGKAFRDWPTGRSWGLRWYLSGEDKGVIFKIRLKIENSYTLSVGPNPVLPEQKAPTVKVDKSRLVLKPESSTLTSTKSPQSASLQNAFSPTYAAGTGDRLLDLVWGAYHALNVTSPNKTKECWLCLTSNPPYYEGIALNANISNVTLPSPRCSISAHRLTLPEITGQGLCLGTPAVKYKPLCNQTITVPTGSYYLEAPGGTLWACNTGLTPCVSASIFKQSYEYCVLVQLWPRVTYHEGETVMSFFEYRDRYRREPISMTIALLLGVGGIAAGIGTGTTALVQNSHLMQLQMAMTNDLEAIEKSITALEKSLTSLSEVVLQNRRGLDLLFLKEGGLCAALKEECCFYADHTGVVRESMEKLRERLAQRRREFETQQGWFESWFNRSPWFTTLISTLAGPLILLSLILTFGPCILNRLIQFVKDRVSVVQTLVLSQQYQLLKPTDYQADLMRERDEWI